LTTDQRTVCLLGELPLVEEYADLCMSKGFSVQARLNAPGHGKRLPAGVTKVRKPARTVDLALELTNIDLKAKKKNLIDLDRALHPDAPICSSSITVTVGQQARWMSHPKRLIGIGAFPSLLSGTLVEIAVSSLTTQSTISATEGFLKALEKEIALVHDAVGLVMPRILCMIVNEACYTLADGVAPRNGIDDAMKLGADYPQGPLEWKDKVGPGNIRAVLEALRRAADKQRYKIAPLLRQAKLKPPSAPR
jgi:3-hydroxybutyryl-CoA dehydrogenase